ncbi:hypothetical protein [Olsenella uli]|uniref:hypothetical protein n=1 Tax=Olsenella uli TaxID=133926 RepID=UPI0028E771F8|nr:hypothetical protein [Olsenella uli]
MGKVSYGQAGYIGQSLSERAAAAYADGEAPRSKWTKSAMLAAIGQWCEDEGRVLVEDVSAMRRDEVFERFFERSSWHHTGAYARETDFYAREEDTSQHSEPEYVGEYGTLEDAEGAAREWLAGQGGAEVIHHKHGIGSIVHHVATVWADTVGDDGEPDGMASVGGADDMTDDLRARFDAAQRSYWRWLDYEDASEGYEEI